VPEAEIEKIKKVKKAITPVAEVQAKKRKGKELRSALVCVQSDGIALATEEAAPAAVKKTKAPKSTEGPLKSKSIKEDKPAEKTNAAVVSTKASKFLKEANGAGAKAKKGKEVLSTERISPSDDDEDEDKVDDEDDDYEGEIDDQTEALLKGFESDGDEDEAHEEGLKEGLKEGQEIPEVPKLSKANQKKIKVVKTNGNEKPGVVYVGRIPHGFYENEMKQYFKQFGNILKLRLSRNRKTGASKHYAFIQFESATVADIVAKTMDNYLLFGHILKVKTVADEQVPTDLFKGANKRFKKVPWNKLEGRKLEQGASEETWEKRNEKEEERRAEKAEKLKAIGYEFEAPKIKSVKGVLNKQSITNSDAEVKAIEAPPTIQEPSNPKKKGKASKEQPVEATPIVEESEKPRKKERKFKAVKEVGAIMQEVNVVPTEDTNKPKQKSKKQKIEVVTETEAPAELPEMKPKTKRAKATLVEKTTVAEESVEKVKKAKKAKKEKSI
jgi:nucleolar protein 15